MFRKAQKRPKSDTLTIYPNIGVQNMPRRKKVTTYLNTAWRVNKSHLFDGFMATVVEGQQRVGKSRYASKVEVEAFVKCSFDKKPFFR